MFGNSPKMGFQTLRMCEIFQTQVLGGRKPSVLVALTECSPPLLVVGHVRSLFNNRSIHAETHVPAHSRVDSAAVIGRWEKLSPPTPSPNQFSLDEGGGAPRTGLSGHVAEWMVRST